MVRNSSRNLVTVSAVVAICSRSVAMTDYSAGGDGLRPRVMRRFGSDYSAGQAVAKG
jgi:hypothetical protein